MPLSDFNALLKSSPQALKRKTKDELEQIEKDLKKIKEKLEKVFDEERISELLEEEGEEFGAPRDASGAGLSRAEYKKSAAYWEELIKVLWETKKEFKDVDELKKRFEDHERVLSTVVKFTYWTEHDGQSSHPTTFEFFAREGIDINSSLLELHAPFPFSFSLHLEKEKMLFLNLSDAQLELSFEDQGESVAESEFKHLSTFSSKKGIKREFELKFSENYYLYVFDGYSYVRLLTFYLNHTSYKKDLRRPNEWE